MELSPRVQMQVGALVEAWAQEEPVGKPIILGAVLYARVERLLVEVTEKVREEF